MGTTGTGSRKALVFWAVGVFAYMVGVFQRQSLGVTGIDAQSRFAVGASGLALLAMLQLLVYAAMQVPVGLLVDRLGSKRILLLGASVMALGQGIFALSGSLPGAVAGRVLVGLGDAMMFLSVIRIINLWFPPFRNPLVVQITGLIGQLGAIAAAVPLIASLHTYGWTPTFLCAAALGLISLVAVAVVLRDRRPTPAKSALGLRTAWHQPGTRLGMWTHAGTQCSAASFTILWGYPYLVQAQGLTPAAAGVLLTALTSLAMIFGPLFGYLAGRFPLRRSWMVLTIIGSTATVWAIVLLWPGHAPIWVLVILTVVLATNLPGSVVGFDYARTFNPTERIGVATGIVNGGGFMASMLLSALIGVAMDLGDDYRLAFAVQFPIWALSVVQILRYRTRARRTLTAELVTEPA